MIERTKTLHYQIKSITLTGEFAVQAEVAELDQDAEIRRFTVDASPAEALAILSRPGTTAPRRDQVAAAAYELIAPKIGG